VSAVAVSPAAVAPPQPVDDEALLRDTVRSAFEYNPTLLAGHLVGAIVIELVFSTVAPAALRLGWGASFAALWLVRALLAWRYAGHEPVTPAGFRVQLRLWQAGALLSAALWGAAAWLFFPYGGAQHQIALVLVVYTFCVASVPILAPQFPIYLCFIAMVFVPAIMRVAIGPGPLSYELATVMAVAMAMTAVLGRNYRIAFHHVLELKLRTEALMAQLRAEKGVAEAARREAETANRAKTQFFTAASHDLRQPLHAMGLFAEALRQRVHEPEVAHLVNSINESVDALEGLFSELLDITRIDSGVIEVHAEHFEVAEILRKLRLNFEPAAFEKGLSLRLRGGARAAFADPLLVERILRNLVANAIRYTHDGSVLVSCRQRGDRLLLQVWDTGVGIREAEQARIFDEFYQVPNTQRVSAEQRRGLGLGLAIVKRLADLMGAPLTLRSRSGHGSVFTLDLPVGRRPRSSRSVVAGKGPLQITLAGRLILVIEDEPAVRAGLEVLLRGWGARVESFDSVAASTAWAGGTDPAPPRPDLLIVDYRLEEGRTGVDAIEALRARFGAKIPAILVTGSTMTGHEREAQQHEFHLLIKPVVPNKLRAMIAFKLGVKPGA
jgi:signal transduction histidine kinase